MTPRIIPIDAQTWRMEEDGVRFFLLTGTESALLIDSGMMTRNALDIAKTLTDLPVKLLNTHADMDHIGSNAQFDTVYMNPAECVNYPASAAGAASITPVWDGDVLDLGQRPLRIVTMPGHTPGSIGVLDVNNRRFFTGDPIQTGNIFMFGPARNLTAYYHSLQKALDLGDAYDEIYPSHAECPVTKELIPQLMEGAKQVMAGEITPAEGNFFGQTIRIYDIGVAKLLGNAQ